MRGIFGRWRMYRQLEIAFRRRTPGAHGANARQNVIERIRGYLRARVFEQFDELLKEGKDSIHSHISYAVKILPKEDVEILDEKVHEGRFFEKLDSSPKFYIEALATLHDTAVIRAGQEADGRLWRVMVETYEVEKKEADAILALNKQRAKTSRLAFLARWGWQTLIVGMLLAAVLYEDHDHSYFIILRFACCAAFGFWAWQAHKLGNSNWRNAFALVAAAYNPFLPLKLEEEWWRGINIATIGLATASGFANRVKPGNPSISINMGPPRGNPLAKPNAREGGGPL